MGFANNPELVLVSAIFAGVNPRMNPPQVYNPIPGVHALYDVSMYVLRYAVTLKANQRD